MKNPDNFNAVFERKIENQVISHWMAAYIHLKFGSVGAYLRVASQCWQDS
jgi:hypothetical protein